MPTVRRSLGFAAGLLVLALAGCQNQEEIRRYQVPREAPLRLLGAIVPHGNEVWFFKAQGPAPAVNKHKEQFEQFVSSIRFTGAQEAPLSWQLPAGWHEEKAEAKGNVPGLRRLGTFRFGPGNEIELTIVPLPRMGEAGSVLANVNRWRGQFGLRPVTEAQLDRVTRRLKVGDTEATLVDITAADTAPPEAAPARAPLAFKLPEGWKPKTPGPFAKLAFQVTEDGKSAEITVSQLGGSGGGLKANVNRWRSQLGLAPVDEQQIGKDAKEVAVGGTKGRYVDLFGPQSSEPRKEMLAVIVERDGETWFFKMTGPAELVSRQKTAFEAFVQSIRFEGAEEGNHE